MDFKEEKIDKSQMVGFSKLLQFSEKKHVIFIIFGTISAIASGLGQPLFIIFIQDLYDSFSPDSDPQHMVDESKRIAFLYLYIGLGLWVLCYLYLAFWGIVSEYTGSIFRVKYLSAVLKQDITWFDQNDAQSLPSKISKESTAIQLATGEKFANILMAFSMSISGYVIGFTLGWKYAFAALATFPFTTLIIYVFILVLQSSYKAGQEAFKMSSTYAEQALNAMKVVVAFGQERKEIERFEKYLEKARSVGTKGHLYSAIGYALNNGAMLLVFAYGMFIGAVFVHYSVYNDTKGRDYTAGDTIAIFFGIIFGTMALGIGAPNFKALAQGRVAGKTILDIIQRKPEILIDDPEASRLKTLKGLVELRNITFSYPLKKVSVLSNLSLKFEKGKSTAIVGHSGSGKSTIVQLIERFYDPQEGSILIDGQDLRKINLRDFRSKVGYVGQEPVLFNQTIRENLLYGNPKANENDMIEALKKANASKIIDKLPQGLDTLVGSGGGQLSGGEKQRIALARAFIKNPSILILDEATSALDRQNEKEVQVAIDNLRTEGSDITTIIIAHRLSTIKNCDKIFVLKEGELVEEGTHRSILEEHPDGVYSDLVRTQEILESLENESNGLVEKEKNWIEEEQHSEGINEPLIPKEVRRLSSTHPNVKNKFEEANKIDEIVEKERQEFLAAMKKKGFFKRLLTFNRPYFFIWLGLICSAIQGMVSPVFGIYYGKTIFSIFADDYKKSCDYCLILALISAVSFIATYFQKISFGIIGENMTKSLRQEIYTSLLKKHIGWFDLKENNAGALTEILSSDVYHLNGASTEAISTIIETMVGLLGGVIIAFFYEWRTALVALGLSPFLTISNAIQVKLQMGFTEMQEGPLKEANLIISDSISNYKTVASFGHEALIVETLQNKLQGPMKSGNKRAHYAGIVFGWATFIQNIVFAALFYLGAVFIKEYGVFADDVFIAIYVIAFASFGAGQAQQFGPATGKAAKSAERIFGIMDEPSDIDVTKAEPREVIANEDTMKGEIEFRNVWFRYPTRKQAWVLKNFSLKINAQETVALVGESGSGKSTIVQLLYRFYDPQFGEIYIDKVNLKDYNLKSLRRQLGLVQQEPVLFNESIEYNITYGIEACNEKDVIRAVEIANASGFISKLGNMPINQNEKVVNHKGEVVSNEAAQYIDEKEEDDKNASEDDISKGLKAICGVKGGKLSGGQKQRVAIARAVIRDPKILLLDEATSALDEVSQRKVKVALEKLMEGRTSIIIAHRLTTIEGADRIIELNNGVISKERPGKGKDNQLLNKN